MQFCNVALKDTSIRAFWFGSQFDRLEMIFGTALCGIIHAACSNRNLSVIFDLVLTRKGQERVNARLDTFPF